MLTEQNHAGEHILSEASGQRSRDSVLIKSGLELAAGTVLGEITAEPGVYAVYAVGNADGTEVAKKVLFGPINTSVTGTNADTMAAVSSRDTELSSGRLTGSDANAVADLSAAGMIVRTSL
jgi:hypothetical protein